MSSTISSNSNSNVTSNNANNTLIYQDTKVNETSSSNFTSVKDGVVSNTPTAEDIEAINKAKALTQTQIINASIFT